MAMSEPRYPRLLAKALARRGRPEPTPVDPAQSAEEIELVQDTLERLTFRRKARIAGGAAAALVVIVGLTLPRLLNKAPPSSEGLVGVDAPTLEVVASSNGEGSMIVSGGSSVPVDGQRALASGGRLLVGPAGGANLTLSTGTRVAVDAGSDVTLVGQGRAAIFQLGAGSLRAEVAKLAPTDRFVVRTEDSEVEVRGTSFRVSVVLPDAACGEGTTTHVNVYEGTVTVRRNGREESVEKGEEWPRGCARSVAPAPLPVAAAPTIAGRTEAGRTSPRSTPHADVSNLGAQNDQFADAMIVKRRGDSMAALAAFDRFLAMYPTSHLAENAAVERMKLLVTVDRASARAAARQYLQKFPSGFARDDALAILAATVRAPSP
jgi:hypothetical protein